ncbi:Uncharacterised protein [Elizabethkingia meningoseptica]|nr:Uncharacterised protein [Elizabethkingia meningoseptica]
MDNKTVFLINTHLTYPNRSTSKEFNDNPSKFTKGDTI